MATVSHSAARMPVAVIGAGAIGRTHAERLMRHPDTMLAGVADPAPAAREFAEKLGVPWFTRHEDMLEQLHPAAVIVATPNAMHARVGLDCVRAGVAMLVEKPIADDPAEARKLCDVAAQAGVPLLVGHQRRHSPALRRAKELIDDGVLGRPVCASVMATWLKPQPYFDLAWRRSKGGGPVLINLIHDIDMVRFLLGEVRTVQAMASNAVRGFEVEDTASASLRMANGALVSVVVTDAAVAPWNWDLGAGEAAHFPQQPVDAHHISGTEGSLTLPHLRLWRYQGAQGWHEPLTMSHTPLHRADPYDAQLHHLREVVEGRAQPICDGTEGLRTLQATLAVLQAAESGLPVELPAS